jgi:hypothetical protein
LQEFVKLSLFFRFENDFDMLDWFEHSFVDLIDFQKRIFVESFYCKNSVDIFTEIHPLDSFFPGVGPINIINIVNLIKFRFGQSETQSSQNSFELISSHNVFSKIVKIEEKLSYSDSFENNLSLNLFHKLLNGKKPFRYFFINIKLLSNGVSMDVFDDISSGIKLFFIGNNTLYNISLHFFDVLNIGNKISVSDFFGIDASSILSAQNINKDLVFNKVQVIQNSDKLFSGDETGLGSIVILQLLFDEDSLAGNHPLDVRKETVKGLILLLSEGLVVVFEGSECGFGEIGVEKLLIDGGNKINIPDKVSGRDSILINNGVDFFIGKTEREESGGSGEPGDELIFNAGTLSKFIIILEESFHSYLFFPNLSSEFSLDSLDISRGSE